MTKQRMILLGVGFFLLLGLFPIGFNMFHTVDAGEICVKQAAFSGELTVHKDAGVIWQAFGKITTYKKQLDYDFTSKQNGIRIRFNDGGNATVHGSFLFEMPKTDDKILLLHELNRSQENVTEGVITAAITKAVYMTGPLMSSKESSAEKRPDILNFVNDQMLNGAYKTKNYDKKTVDPLSGKETTVTITEIRRDSAGLPLRQEVSAVETFGIKISNLSIKEIVYDKKIEQQIAEQQNAIMRVQTAIADARAAEQDAIKAEASGRADAARARADAEVAKVKAVTEAEKTRDVAKLKMEEAEFYKRKQILEGEGDAAKKRLAAQADGSLEQRLEAYVKVQEAWAKAFSETQQPLVPSVVAGGGNGQSAASDWMNMMMLQAAKDLGVNTKIKN